MSKHILFDAVTKILCARYDSEIHGSRQITVVDPSFAWPQIEQQNYRYDPKSSIDGPTLLVDDPDIIPPTINIDNPDCKIPVEAIDVSDDMFFRTIVEQDGIWSLVDGEIVKLPLPLPTSQELMRQAVNAIRNALQSEIDKKAITLGFSNGNSLMLYAGFTNAFQPLAQAFATWEASVWVEAEAYKAQVIAGEMPMLSAAEAVAMMPEYPEA